MSKRVTDLPAAGSVASGDLLHLMQPSTTVVYTASTISATASDNSINDSAAQFVAEGFTAGKAIRIAGFTGAGGNNGYAVVESVEAGKMVLSGITLVDDAAGESVTITQMDSKRVDAQDIADLAAAAVGDSAAGLRFTSDTGSTADSDPGPGLFKWNNGTQGSAGVIFLDDETLDAVAVTTWLASLDPGGDFFIQQLDDSTRWQYWRCTGITDASGYTKLAVALLAKGADIQDNKACAWLPTPGNVETWAFACSDYKTTALAAATDVGGLVAPYAAKVLSVSAGAHDAQTSGSILTVDINEAGTTILSTKITIDNGENSSLTAATPPVLSDANIAAGAKVTADVDQIGDGTAKGLTCYLRVIKQ